jgi:creatinine amidohydrolase
VEGIAVLPRRQWADMTWQEIHGADTGAWIAVLPVAAVEQHGPHLPLGTDLYILEGILARVLPLLPDDVPASALPVQAVGVSPEHLAFPGTLTLSPALALGAWTELGDSLARAGIRKLLVLSSHGGNSAVINILARELRVRHGMLAVSGSLQRFGYPDGLFDAAEIAHGIHGGDIETSLMLALRPDLVRADKLADFTPASVALAQHNTWLGADRPFGFGWMSQDLNGSGAIGHAARATRDKGEAAADHAARGLVALLGEIHRFAPDDLPTGPLG